MNLFLDLLVVAIAVLTILSAMRRGFIRSVIELIGFFVSLIVSGSLSVPLGAWLYDHFLKSVLTDGVQKQFSAITGGTQQAFAQMLNGFHLNAGVLGTVAKNGTDAANSALINGLVQPLGVMIGRGIAFIILFFLCMAVIHIVANFSDIVGKLPVIGSVNHIGGAAVGVVEAALGIFVLCTLISILLPIFSVEKTPLLTNTTIEKTTFFKYFYHSNPINELLLKK